MTCVTWTLPRSRDETLVRGLCDVVCNRDLRPRHNGRFPPSPTEEKKTFPLVREVGALFPQDNGSKVVASLIYLGGMSRPSLSSNLLSLGG